MERVRSLLPGVLKKRGMFEHAMASLVLLRAQAWIDREFPKSDGRLRARAFDAQGVLMILGHDAVSLAACRERLHALTFELERTLEPGLVKKIVVLRG